MLRTTRSFWKKLAISGLLSATVLAPPLSSWAAQATVSWEGSEQAETAGYKVYVGRTPRSYSTVMDVGQSTSTTLTDLEEGRVYYVSVKAYGEGLESPYSAEIVYSVPRTAPAQPAQAQAAKQPLSSAALMKATPQGLGQLHSGNGGSTGLGNGQETLGRTPSQAVEADPTPAVTEIPQTDWQLMYVDSEELLEADYAAVNAFDGDVTTLWLTQEVGAEDAQAHEIQIDLGEVYDLRGFRYLPRQDDSPEGQIQSYEFYVSHDGHDWGRPVAKGMFATDGQEQEVEFSSTIGRYIRLRALSDGNGEARASVAELNVLAAW
jgi:F5/8 type C domain/Fibronectin type III domain